MDCPDESTLAAFAAGNLPRAELEAIERHARSCRTCPARISAAVEAAGAATRTMADPGAARVRPRAVSDATPATPSSAPEAAPAAPLERGASIGRYTILAIVGRGGMGEVYAAYDPELDRKIALKLLRARGADAQSRTRLLREAKAIAKLSHPNVVVVHDAGTFEDRVFIAMEFIEGQTLKEWLAEAPRTRREILEVFLKAGRGLNAAHAAGLVHRDFKPHNVMVGRDGGVRVMDFGLARRVDAAPESEVQEPGAPPLADAIIPASPSDLTFTRTGELVGTPLYMAPEQFLAMRTDARTDQFSFCVALYLALYRVHPFAGDTLDLLIARVVAGEVQAPPARNDVPAWLRRVLVRGLALTPQERWPSMAALIEALEQDPLRARRRWGAAAGVALLAGGAVVALVTSPRRTASLCSAGPSRLAGAWETPGAGARSRRDAVEAAFTRTGGSAARDAWPRVAAILDRYAAAWLGMYRDACEATHARGEQSAETLELRMACLDERRASLAALSDVLVSADATAVSRAVDAANALPGVDGCADVKALREPTDTPRDPATRARAQGLRERLAAAKALNDVGRHDEAMRRMQALVDEARALGNRSLLAESLEAHAELQDGEWFRAEAIAELEEAVWTALSVKRDTLAARGAAWVAGYIGTYLGQHEEAQPWVRLAHALLERLGPGHDLLRAWLLHDEGGIELTAHDLDGALRMLKEALALKRRLLPPDHPDIASTLSSIAEVLHQQGKDDDAIAMAREALEIFSRGHGEGGLGVARMLNNEGEYLVAAGRAADAAPLFERSLAIVDHHQTGDLFLSYPLTGLGQARLALGQPDAALPLLERAERLRASSGHALDVADTRFALARALWDTKADRPRARALAADARDAYAHVPAETRALAPVARNAGRIDAWFVAHK